MLVFVDGCVLGTGDWVWVRVKVCVRVAVGVSVIEGGFLLVAALLTGHVTAVRPAVTKPTLANVALVRFLPRMDPRMLDQMVFVTKSFVAVFIRAFESSKLCVVLIGHVVFQVGEVGERLVTDFAEAFLFLAVLGWGGGWGRSRSGVRFRGGQSGQGYFWGLLGLLLVLFGFQEAQQVGQELV